MKVVGITGGIASGKSTLSAYLKDRYKAYIFNADEEAKKAVALFKEEFIRELYSIKGGKGACMIVEANSEEEILIKLSDLPFVKNNYLDIDIIEVKPYRGCV